MHNFYTCVADALKITRVESRYVKYRQIILSNTKAVHWLMERLPKEARHTFYWKRKIKEFVMNPAVKRSGVTALLCKSVLLFITM